MHLNIQLAIAGIGTGAVIAILALGMVAIHKGSGVLNFGHSAIATLSAYLFLWLQEDHGVSRYVAFLAGLALSVGIGAGFYLIVMSKLRTSPPLAGVVATLGLMVAGNALVEPVFGDPPSNIPFLPQGVVRLPVGSPHFTIGVDRLWLAAIALGCSLLLASLFRYTQFGLRTRALADNELALAVTGHSAARVAVVNWMLGSGLAGLGGMLIATFTPITPTFFTILLVTAIAAALLGGFKSFQITFVAAMLIGLAQPIVTLHSPGLRSLTGLQGWTDALPLMVIIVIYVVRGRGLPLRDLIVTRALPNAPNPRNLRRSLSITLIIALAWILFIPVRYIQATSTSLIYTVLALSLVAIVGYVGQVSLAQLTFAGAGAFTAAAVSTSWGVPFPIPILIGGLVAVPCGILFGLPALRVRGIDLAVVTLALAVAVERLLFNDVELTGGDLGRSIAEPSIFGLSLDPLTEGRRFAIAMLVITTLLALGLVLVRRSGFGMRLLAIRGNERGATASGVSLMTTKLAGFSLSAFIAGCGGAMMAYQYGQIGPASFTTLASVTLLAFAYVAGIGTISGAVLAGLLIPYGLVSELIGIHNDVISILGGVGMIVMVVLHPSGLAGLPGQIRHHQAEQRARAAAGDNTDDISANGERV
ncbi:ABC transporter permease [Pedococcus sp. P5_B7]